MSGITYDTGALIGADRDPPPDMGIAPQSTRAWRVTDSPSRGSWPGMAGRAPARTLPASCGLPGGGIVRSVGQIGRRTARPREQSDLIEPRPSLLGAVAREDAIFSSDRADMEALLARFHKHLQIVDV